MTRLSVLTLAGAAFLAQGDAEALAAKSSTYTGGIPMGNGQTLPIGVKRVGALESPTAQIDGSDERVNVDVAVLDTGIEQSNPDLNVVGGINLSQAGGSNDWQDDDGHGTHIAAAIGALDNNRGIVGVAPGSRLFAIKISSNDEGIVEGLNWLADHPGNIDVVNISQAFARKGQARPGSDIDQRLHGAVNRVLAAGIAVVTSAGNSGKDESGTVPGAYDGVINVSAFTDTDGLPGGAGPDDGKLRDGEFWKESNYGPGIELAAPGTGILSLIPGGSTALGDGTSFAAPLVTGAAALYLASHPGASPGSTRDALIAAREQRHLPRDSDSVDEGVVNVRGM